MDEEKDIEEKKDNVEEVENGEEKVEEIKEGTGTTENVEKKKEEKVLTPYERFKEKVKYYGYCVLGIVKNVAKFAIIGGLTLAPFAAMIKGIVDLAQDGLTTSSFAHTALGAGAALLAVGANIIAYKESTGAYDPPVIGGEDGDEYY